MKQIIPIALLLGAAPALLFGQVTVNCPDETCQVAPYFAGSGGFVGESAGLDGEPDVSFFVVCGNVTISGVAEPDSQGIVRQALSGNLACPDRGRLEIDNLKPGGWYWINDDRNSAVAAFIPKSAAGNEQIVPTDPGGLVIDREEDGLGTYVKHTPTGRVGIIPHVVPARPIKGCSGMAHEETATDCHLGSPEGWRVSASPSSVVRPAGGQQSREVVVKLYGQNFVRTGQVAARAALEHHLSVEAIVFNQNVGVAPAEGESGVLGWSLEVGGDDARCLPANNNPDRTTAQTITFMIAEMEGVVPDAPNDSVKTTITVNCPAESAASAGAELVPDNPFPPTVD